MIFFNWVSPANVSRLAPPKNALTGPPHFEKVLSMAAERGEIPNSLTFLIPRGGQSRDMFRGGPVKKITLNKEDKLIIRTPSEKLSGLLRRSVSSSGGEVEIRKC